MEHPGRRRPAAITRYRISLAVFLFGLVLSGLSAFPLEFLTGGVRSILGTHGCCCEPPTYWDGIHEGLVETYGKYPWIAYGTDWLGFGHLVIALFFIGPMIDPSTARPNLLCGLAACAAIVPFALLAGPVRGIPFGWRMVDCSFGLLGAVPLLYCLRQIPRIKIRPRDSDRSLTRGCADARSPPAGRRGRRSG